VIEIEVLEDIWYSMLEEFPNTRLEDLIEAFGEETGMKPVWETLDGYFVPSEAEPALMVWYDPSRWFFVRIE